MDNLERKQSVSSSFSLFLKNRRDFVELFIFIGITLVIACLFPAYKGAVTIMGVIYFVIERKVRKKTKEEVGFVVATIPQALRKNAFYILLVGIVMQSIYVYTDIHFFPEVYQHVLERVPVDLSAFSTNLVLSLILLAFGEEIVFRGLIQARLNKVMPTSVAILLTSLLFTIMHASLGAPLVIVLDLITVFIDSVLYGIIFAKTQNIFIATIAHALANTMATLLFLIM